jgi:hypothetical protein
MPHNDEMRTSASDVPHVAVITRHKDPRNDSYPLPTRLNKLADEAAKFKDLVDWPVGEIANTLLEQAKQESDDPVLASIQLLEPTSMSGKVAGHTGLSLALVLRQAADCLPEPKAEPVLDRAGGTITGDLANKQF